MFDCSLAYDGHIDLTGDPTGAYRSTGSPNYDRAVASLFLSRLNAEQRNALIARLYEM